MEKEIPKQGELNHREMFLAGLKDYKNGLYSNALKSWRQLQLLDPTYPNLAMFMNVCERQELSGWEELGHLEKDFLEKRSSDGLEILDIVQEAQEKFSRSMENGSRDEARNILAQLALDRPSDLEALKCQVEGYKKLSEPTKMVEAAKKIMDLSPYSSASHLMMGDVLLHLDKAENSLIYFQNCIKLDPENFRGYSRLGAAYLKLDKRREASEFLEKAISLNPNLEKAQILASRLQTDMQEMEARILEYYEKIGTNKRYPDVLYRLGVLYRKTGHLEKAFLVLDEALSQNELYREAILEKARLQVDLELYREACETLNPLVSGQDDYAGYGNIQQFLKTGYFEEAARELLRVLRVESDFGAVHIELGKEFYNDSHFDRALDELSRGLYLCPHYADGHYFKGLCLEKQGKPEESLSCFLEALELNPVYEKASLAAARISINLGKDSDARRILKGLLASASPHGESVQQAKVLLEKIS